MKILRTETQKGPDIVMKSNLLLTLFVMTTALFLNAVPLRASDTVVEKKEDAAITAQVKTSLLYHLSLNFQVKTNEGVVTLSGTADDITEKDLNTQLATKIKGVKNVVNNMVIPVTVAGTN